MARERTNSYNLSKSHLLLLFVAWLDGIAFLLFTIYRDNLSSSLFVLCCTALFLVTTFLISLIGQEFFTSYTEPILIAKSKLIAGMLENKSDRETSAKLFSQPLTDTVDMLMEELVAARQRERLIADFSPEILCCLNSDRIFLEMNLQTEIALGHSVMTLLGKVLDSIVLDEDLAQLIAYFNDCKTGTTDRTVECRVRKSSGQVVDLEWQAEWSNSAECFYCVAKDITQRNENERLKREIAAMVTHDLRAPITGINFLLQNLEQGILGELPERAREEIVFAQESVDGVLGLINKLLDADKLESGRMECEMRPFRLTDLYKHARPMLAKLAERKNVEIEFPVSEAVAYADMAKSSQILTNLLSNAIKWSSKNSVITVSEERKGLSIVINVSDNGPGIPESRQETIFDRFKSIPAGEAQEIASSGLGLYIAKKLAELQSGNIGVRSKPGEGSTFWFSMRQKEQ